MNPGQQAKRAANRQAELLRRERQEQGLQLAEEDGRIAKKKAISLSPTKGRRALINPQERRASLG